MIRWKCLHCNEELSARDDEVGELVECTRCSELVKVPAPKRRERPAEDANVERPRRQANDVDAPKPRRNRERDDEVDDVKPRRNRERDDEVDDVKPRRNRERDDEVDDADDRPRRRRKRPDDEEDGPPEARPGRCPGCGSRYSSKVSFTWWGGLLGPSLFSTVKCDDCSVQYNKKTGKHMGGYIAIYMLISVVIVIGIFAVIGLSGK